MENILNAIIIDDDHVATEQLRSELSKYQRLRLVGNASSGSEGRLLIMNSTPDVIFLDVEMPDCVGFDFLRSVRGLLKSNCHVIFYTAYDKYMINALREKAFDFLLKPIDPEEVCKVMSRILEDENSEIFKEDGNSIILNTVLGEIIVVKPDDISFFTYDEKRRCWSVTLTSDTSYVLRRSTKSDKILSFSSIFMQVDKSHIINKTKLSSVVNGHCLMQAPLDYVDDILISNSKLTELRSTFPNL